MGVFYVIAGLGPVFQRGCFTGPCGVCELLYNEMEKTNKL
jgi:hypothetical protein